MVEAFTINEADADAESPFAEFTAVSEIVYVEEAAAGSDVILKLCVALCPGDKASEKDTGVEAQAPEGSVGVIKNVLAAQEEPSLFLKVKL